MMLRREPVPSRARVARLARPLVAVLLALSLAACQRDASRTDRPLTVSAIPDQDPEKLQRLYGSVADYLSRELGVPVEYRPVTDYAASVTAFKVGDLDLVWYGGLTGVQARLQVPGARTVAQRDIDTAFRSVFIAGAATGITSVEQLPGRSFTFGSESSTSGRLMPQFFLQERGITLDRLKGEPGFSGSHDKTVDLVQAGTFDAGVVNEQVWKRRLDSATVDTTKVRAFWVTPPYHDYHWVLNPGAERRFGEGFADRVRDALLKLDPARAEDRAILELFGARKFVPARDGDYTAIERVGRQLGLVTGGAPAR